MMVIAIPSQKEALPAIKYMLDLGDRRLSQAELDLLESEIGQCRRVNDCMICDCIYAKQCVKLFDRLIYHAKWN